MVTPTRSLPGIRFADIVDEALPALPPLDGTALVGYAAAGPLDVPVLIEDVAHFREVFGSDVILAEDAAGSTVTSQLGGSVDGFFANGGTRCWVVRVASGAATTVFTAPGLVDVADPGDADTWRVATFTARSPGTAFDGLGVSARIAPSALAAEAPVDLARGTVQVRTSAAPAPGELLELRFSDGVRLWAEVASVTVSADGSARLAWDPAGERWLRAPAPGTVLLGGHVTVIGADGPVALAVDELTVEPDGRLRMHAAVPPSEAPQAGAVFAIPLPDGLLLAAVHQAPVGIAGVAPRTLLVAWPARLLLDPATARLRPPGERVTVGLLRMDLRAMAGDAELARLEGLALGRGHPRWWGALPTDAQLYGRIHRRRSEGGERPRPGPLDAVASRPRFPFAAVPPGTAMAPIAVGAAFAPATGATAASTVRADRHGLAVHAATTFLDQRLEGLAVPTLRTEARRLFHVEEALARRDDAVDPAGDRLAGLHAVMPVGEVAVVAVPDAVHAGWVERPIPGPTPLPSPELRLEGAPLRLTWTLDPSVEVDGVEIEAGPTPDLRVATTNRTVLQGDPGSWDVDSPVCGLHWFRLRARSGGAVTPWSVTLPARVPGAALRDCAEQLPAAPAVRTRGRQVRWEAVRTGEYEVQVAAQPDFRDARTHRTDGLVHDVPVSAGVTYVRVRADDGSDGAGPWSVTVGFTGAGTTRREIPAAARDGVAPVAARVHRALGRLAAARADLTGLLSFPDWYRMEELEAHLAGLHGGANDEGDASLAHLSAYHPWVRIRHTTGGRRTVRLVPPDGVVAGRLATTDRHRGAWIAGLSEPLAEALGPSVVLGRDARRRLLLLQVNPVVGRSGRAFVAGCDTLVTDPAIRPLTVRRLLILVHRLANREGMRQVFDSNGSDTRRLLVTRFEALLGELFRRGALTGATPAEAFRVICDSGLNPPASVDAGRLVVELQVAPTLPLEFLVVRMVQAGAGGLLEVTG